MQSPHDVGGGSGGTGGARIAVTFPPPRPRGWRGRGWWVAASEAGSGGINLKRRGGGTAAGELSARGRAVRALRAATSCAGRVQRRCAVGLPRVVGGCEGAYCASARG